MLIIVAYCGKKSHMRIGSEVVPGQPTQLDEQMKRADRERDVDLSMAFHDGIRERQAPLYEAYFDESVDVPRALRLAFPATFKLSGGSPFVQAMLQLRVAQMLQAHPDGRETLQEIAASLEINMDTFHVPRAHAGGKSLHRMDERTPVIWEFFMDICRNVNSLDNLKAKDKFGAEAISMLETFGKPTFIPVDLFWFMTERDLDYVKNGRPNRQTDEARYKSYIREHTILGRPTGSREIDIVMTELGFVIDAYRSYQPEDMPSLYIYQNGRRRLFELQEAWEARHQQPFFITVPGE